MSENLDRGRSDLRVECFGNRKTHLSDFGALCIMILKYRDSIVQHKLLIPSSVKHYWEHSSIHEWLSLRPIRQGCNQQLRQGCATYNSESFSWSPNWASCGCHCFWNQSRLMEIPKNFPTECVRVGVRKLWYSEKTNWWNWIFELTFLEWYEIVLLN